MGTQPINSPHEHFVASDLEGWYPIIADLTPRTCVFEALPTASELEKFFDWPIFVKGARQTSKHNPALSIARDRLDYSRLCEAYRHDDILHWQRPVIRQFIALDRLPGAISGKLSPSREFRTFWWHGNLVGCGHYWYQLPAYGAPDLKEGLTVAHEASGRLAVPFLVVDIARTATCQWIVIECNDAQEAGYVGLAPQLLWSNILARL